MKKAFLCMLVLLGLLPYFLGFYINERALTPIPFFVSLLFLLSLACIAFLANRMLNDPKAVVIAMNLAAGLDLLLVGFQELILGRYWVGWFGAATQLYYLPVLGLGFSVTPWTHTLFSAYLASFLLMAAASYLGCRLEKAIISRLKS